MKDYYRILGVLDDAEDIIIKAAYRALAQRYHPDKWSGNQAQATKRMAEINEAYSVLSNAVEKKKYDEDGLLITVEVIPNFELEKVILSFGDSVKVLSPKSLVTKITERLNNSIQQY